MTRDKLLSTLYWLSWADWCSWYVALLLVGIALFLLVALFPRTQTVSPFSSLLFPASCAVGITLAYLAPQTVAFWVAALAFLIVATLLFFSKKTLFTPCLLLLAAGALRTITSQSFHHYCTSLLREHSCTINGVVAAKEGWCNHPKGSMVTIQTTHICYVPLATSLRYYLYTNPSLTVGDALVLFKVKNDEKRSEDEAFSRYRWRHNLSALFFQPSLRSRRVARPAPGWEASSWWYQQRTTLYSRLKTLLSPSVFAYCGSLFFGNRDHPSSNKTRDLFARWGLVHYLARSGLHIALIIALWSSMLLWLPLPLQGKLLLLLFLLYSYSMLSWTSLSYQRALWLFVLLCGGALLRRRPHTMHLLSLLATLTMLSNPAHLFFLDFQLTFFLTFVLLVLSTFLRRKKQMR